MSCKEEIDYEMLISDMQAGIYGLKVLLADNDRLLEEIEKRDAAVEAAKASLNNAYDHIQHEDYNDALSSILEAKEALKEK